MGHVTRCDKVRVLFNVKEAKSKQGKGKMAALLQHVISPHPGGHVAGRITCLPITRTAGQMHVLQSTEGSIEERMPCRHVCVEVVPIFWQNSADSEPCFFVIVLVGVQACTRL